MCTVCGCGGGGAGGEARRGERVQRHDPHHRHGDRDPGLGPGDLDFGAVAECAPAPGTSRARLVAMEADILGKNDRYAAANRARLATTGTLALNLVSSPGSGKTTLLVATVAALQARLPVAVIEGDQRTANDAERIRATGAPAVQVNTGKACHLDAHMVGHAIDRLPIRPGGVLFIENVGNLICPAAFDLGEAAKVAILSVTEGEDKPLKYPDMFAASRLAIVNKIDLAPHCGVDLALCAANIARINPRADILFLSARTGEGMAAWFDWIDARRAEPAAPAPRAASAGG